MSRSMLGFMLWFDLAAKDDDMLLKCPHCDNEANIPNALSQYENMPIACHACGGFFFAPPPDPDEPAIRSDDNMARPDQQVARSNQQIECLECGIPVLIPHIDAAGARHKFSCPACHADLPATPTDLTISAKTLSAFRPESKPRAGSTISFLAIAIAIGIGVGVAIGVLLAQNMIALDAGNLGGFINQTGQQFIHLWHQTLAALSLG